MMWRNGTDGTHLFSYFVDFQTCGIAMTAAMMQDVSVNVAQRQFMI